MRRHAWCRPETDSGLIRNCSVTRTTLSTYSSFLSMLTSRRGLNSHRCAWSGEVACEVVRNATTEVKELAQAEATCLIAIRHG